MESTRSGRGAGVLRAVVAAVIALTALAVASQLSGRPEPFRDTLALATLVFLPLGLASTTLLGLQWRWAQSTAAGWLAVLLGAAVVHGILTTSARALSSSATAAVLPWEVAVDLGVGVGLLALVLSATRTASSPRHVLVLAATPAPGLAVVLLWQSDAVVRLVPLLVVSISALTALAVWRRITPGWLARRAAVALGALGTARALVDSPVDGGTALMVGLCLELVAALLLCDTALLLLMSDLRQEALLLRGLHDRLETSVSAHRDDQERLHEIASTVAGISSATRLVRHEVGVSPEARQRLQDMLDQETARLARLLDRGHETTQGPHVTTTDLDEVIGCLVLAQQAQGRGVRWRPSGLRVAGRPDEIVEVLHILLENAAVHAPRSTARVEVTRTGSTVQVAVLDRGPGIPEEAARRIFEWGGHGPDSPGHGIGLHVARRLSTANGGDLRHDATAAGARFVVDLQLARASS